MHASVAERADRTHDSEHLSSPLHLGNCEFITDWILIILFLIKLYYGVKLSWKIVNPGQIDEDFLLDELGEERFKHRVMAK